MWIEPVQSASFSCCRGDNRALPSFPTRRSSDLERDRGAAVEPAHHVLVRERQEAGVGDRGDGGDRKSTRLNSSHPSTSYAVFCLKKKTSPTRPALKQNWLMWIEDVAPATSSSIR